MISDSLDDWLAGGEGCFSGLRIGIVGRGVIGCSTVGSVRVDTSMSRVDAASVGISRTLIVLAGVDKPPEGITTAWSVRKTIRCAASDPNRIGNQCMRSGMPDPAAVRPSTRELLVDISIDKADIFDDGPLLRELAVPHPPWPGG